MRPKRAQPKSHDWPAVFLLYSLFMSSTLSSTSLLFTGASLFTPLLWFAWSCYSLSFFLYQRKPQCRVVSSLPSSEFDPCRPSLNTEMLCPGFLQGFFSFCELNLPSSFHRWKAKAENPFIRSQITAINGLHLWVQQNEIISSSDFPPCFRTLRFEDTLFWLVPELQISLNQIGLCLFWCHWASNRAFCRPTDILVPHENSWERLLWVGSGLWSCCHSEYPEFFVPETTVQGG